jgi:hypothetical protein
MDGFSNGQLAVAPLDSKVLTIWPFATKSTGEYEQNCLSWDGAQPPLLLPVFPAPFSLSIDDDANNFQIESW